VEARLDIGTGILRIRTSETVISDIARDWKKIELRGYESYSFNHKLEISKDEELYGSGQHAGYSAHGGFGLVGRTVYLAQRNTDIAIPMVISSKGYGILWDMHSFGILSIRGGELRAWFEAGKNLDYYLISGPDLDKVISGYRFLTGAAPLLPKWAFGYWQSKERYASQDEIISVAREFVRRGIPIDVIVLDWRYWGKYGWNAFKFDEKDFPDPEAMVRELHSMGIKVAISIWPIFGKDTEIYREMEEKGCVFQGTGLLNAFKRECGELFWRKIEEVFASKGFDAWWLDASEPEIEPRLIYTTWQHDLFPEDLNLYPLFETEAVYRGQRSSSSKRVVILTRSAFAGQQRNSAINWSGDVTGDWTTLRTQIWAGLNLAASGIPYWTTDIGGFFSGNPETEGYRELFVRWFQFGVFCPIFRVHGTYYPKEPWRFGEKVEEILKKYIKLRYRLIPYIYSLAWKVYSEGYTIMRPLVMDFREDPIARSIDDQYMFGPSIMVSPITSPSTTEREVYLPRGLWYNFWTGEMLAGGKWIMCEAPLDRIPLHVRAGSIIPMNPPEISRASEKPEWIELRIYGGLNGRFDLYNDDGETYSYEDGDYSVIPIEWRERDQTLVIGKHFGKQRIQSLMIRIVWVERGRGLDIDAAEPDQEIVYRGDEIRIKRNRGENQ
jgi:alpha-D-xyloside xylohydrolase